MRLIERCFFVFVFETESGMESDSESECVSESEEVTSNGYSRSNVDRWSSQESYLCL